MPSYQRLKEPGPDRPRTIDRLLALREQLDAEIPPKETDRNLLLATWNIRDFDKPAFGKRLPEAMQYIAEIIARFDIIAIQEVYEDLEALNDLMELLGPNWSRLFTDVTEGTQGNGERMAFVYDTRKVRFSGLAGELVLAPLERRDPVTKQIIYEPSRQLVRTPFSCGFTAGWTDFVLNTVHILYGKGTANDPDRLQEIREIAQFIRRRSLRNMEWSRNFILLGDFNIFKPTDDTMKAITDAGFVVPKALQHLPSNVPQNKFYDQIALLVRPGKFEPTGVAGVFNYYNSVFRDEDETAYVPHMGSAYHTTSDGKPRQNPSTYYRTYWRTHQMSDHLPMWVEIEIDHSDDFLRKLQQQG